MFEFISALSENDAISILKKDHDTVKGLFEDFKNAASSAQKKQICVKTLEELRIHTAIEEEIFYPALRSQLKKDVMNEADEEHHIAKLLVAELTLMTGKEDHFDSKYHVMSECVRHHIKEEEDTMFPQARSLDIDYKALGEKLTARKEELKKKGTPKVAEDKLMASAGKNADSPAKAASRKTAPKKVSKKPIAKVIPKATTARKLVKNPLQKEAKKLVRGLVGVTKKASKKMMASSKIVVPFSRKTSAKKSTAVTIAKPNKAKKAVRKKS